MSVADDFYTALQNRLPSTTLDPEHDRLLVGRRAIELDEPRPGVRRVRVRSDQRTKVPREYGVLLFLLEVHVELDELEAAAELVTAVIEKTRPWPTELIEWESTPSRACAYGWSRAAVALYNSQEYPGSNCPRSTPPPALQAKPPSGAGSKYTEEKTKSAVRARGQIAPPASRPVVPLRRRGDRTKKDNQNERSNK